MANFETTPPVTTDCKRQSKVSLPVKRWACVDWRFDVASNSLEFLLDGKSVTPVAGLELPPGPHKITCATSDGKTQSATVVVPEGGTTRYKFTL